MRIHYPFFYGLVKHGTILLLVVGSFAAAAHSQTFSAPLQLATSGMAPKIAVDASGNISAVWRDAVNYTVWFARSTDGGTTFSAPMQISGIPPQFNRAPAPQIVIDSNGTIHLLAAGNASKPPGHELFYARSTDNGSTFSTNPITQGAGADSPGLLVLGASGSVNILWAGMAAAGPLNIQLSRSTDGGRSFETTTVWNWPSNLNPGSGGLALTLDANENIYVAIPTATTVSPSNCDVLVSSSMDQGKTFSPPVNVSHSAACADNAQIAVGKSGDVVAIWEEEVANGPSDIFLSRSSTAGTSFSAPVALEASGTAINPDVVVDQSGDILAVWFVLGGGGSSDHGTYLRRSTDGGSTFSSAIKLGDFLFGSPITIDTKGNIEIAGSGNSQIVLVRSTDGGTTFSGPVPIVSGPTSKTQSCPTFSQMAVDAAGDINVIWDEVTKTSGPGGACDSLPNFVYFSRASTTQGDFTISAAPASQIMLPGGAAKFNVTLTSTSSFSNTVDLSCGKLPSGSQCAFDSSSVTPTGSGAQTTLTVTTPPTLAAGNFNVTITAASGSISHTQDVQVTVGGLSGSVSPSSAAISVSSSGNFAVSVASTGGFTGQVNLACGGLASGLACSFNPGQVTLAANGSATSTLTVSVASKPSISLAEPPVANPAGPLSGNLPPLTIVAALLIAVVILRSQQRPKNLSSNGAWNTERFFVVRGGLLRMTRARSCQSPALAAFALALVLAVGLISCGGATSSPGTSGAGTTAATATTGSTAGTSGTGGTGGGTSGTGGGTSGGTSGGGGTAGGGTSGGTGGGSSITTQFNVQAQSGGATVNLGTVAITVP